ncbi:O-antigen ligase [Paenochrobactrum gallinarii]|uniref:O-antigen ligase n=1 Tax=Paenochrobactrum gallinarii TaxID=643673 RepID=A0A841M1Z1_9HYPH|nr:O-antigen ligase family protein [Paenochrobactrum gallinarii]MBB6260381.1 O-antigen ligase [Paenochrobactrum gallinarii]
MAAAFALIVSLYSGARVGVGGNQAVFAFVAAIGAISATLPIHNAPRFLPNGPQWLALGLLGVMVSETRAVLAVLPLILAVEIIAYVRKLSWQKQIGIYTVLAAFMAAMLVVGPAGKIIETRFTSMINYYETGDATVWSDKVSADIRMAMWRGAYETIKEYPLTGVGSLHKVEIVQSHLGEERALLDGFIHLHNVVVDELLNSGIIGLFLLLASFLSIFFQLWKTAPDCGTKRVLSYFALVMIAYGMLHAPLAHEASIASIMLFLGVLNAARVKRIIYKPHLNAA